MLVSPADRHPAGHLGRAVRPVRPDHHAGARLHADDADVRLPGAADPVLPDRPGVRGHRHADLRGAAGDPDHRARHPRGAARRPSRRPTSLGSTRAADCCIKVLLPMAKRTIVLGINQTIMAALSMVTIAALIDAPGPRPDGVQALQTLDVGTAVQRRPGHRHHGDRPRPGHHGGQRARGGGRGAREPPARRLAPAAAHRRAASSRRSCVYLSYTYVWAAEFPGRPAGPSAAPISSAGDTVDQLGAGHLSGADRARSRTRVTNGAAQPVAGAARPTRRGG